MSFELDPVLEKDTLFIADWPLCRVLRMNDARFPWFILVPRENNICEIHELSDINQHTLLEEITYTTRALEAALFPAKLNVAALGNIVPQLHIHVIARFKEDAAWPGPVWGVGEAELFSEQEINNIIRQSLELLGKQGGEKAAL